jgi:Domain of unknown function (DUF4253)
VGILDFLFRHRRPAAGVAPPVVDPAIGRRARRAVAWTRFLEELNYPFELISGAESQAALESERVRGRTKGFCPLIIQPGFDGRILSKPKDLKNSKIRTPTEYFAQRARDLAHDPNWLTIFDDVEEVEPKGGPAQLYVVDWLSETRPLSPFAEVAMLRLPCVEGWKIPLFVDFIEPFDQSGRTPGREIGIEKEWYDRFGAELCCLGARSWQFRVARPPQEHRQAVELLRQHYLYCWVDGADDKEHVKNGAAALRVDTYWQFFWT